MGDDNVTRGELERALRFLNLAISEAREDLLRVAAQVVALTDELAQRVGAPLVDAVAAATPARTDQVLAADERSAGRVLLDDDPLTDKYEIAPTDLPCAELIHLCGAACCRVAFALSTQDLDEGIVRWDYGRPYLNRRDTHGRCVHHDAAGGGCTIHAHRPATCRRYSCEHDPRVWKDFARRIPAGPPDALPLAGPPPDDDFDLHARARRRQLALTMEAARMRGDDRSRA